MCCYDFFAVDAQCLLQHNGHCDCRRRQFIFWRWMISDIGKGWKNRIFSGQSFKAPTIVIYDSRVVPDLKLPHIMTLGS